MKIINVVQRFHPAVGGSENQVRLISRELSKRSHNVSIITTDSMSSLDVPSFFHKPKFKISLPKFEKKQEVEIYRYKTLFRFYGFLLTQTMKKLYTLDADIIHSYGYYITTSLAAAFAAKSRRIPFILTANDADIGLQANIAERLSAKLYSMTFGKILTTISSNIIAVSKPNAEDLIKMGIEPEKVVIITNGIDDKKFNRNDSGEFRKKHCLDGPLILFVGRISKHKGIQYLIQAAPLVLKNFPHVKFLIIGEDYGYLDKLKNLSNKLGIKDSIVFLNSLPEKEIVKAYKAADLFVLPSELEAFGLVLIEAMAAGVPVIGCKYGGIKHIIKDGENGLLFDPGNVKQLAKKIELILSDKEIRIKLANQGQKEVIQKYTIEKTVDKIEELYRTILNKQ